MYNILIPLLNVHVCVYGWMCKCIGVLLCMLLGMLFCPFLIYPSFLLLFYFPFSIENVEKIPQESKA